LKIFAFKGLPFLFKSGSGELSLNSTISGAVNQKRSDSHLLLRSTHTGIANYSKLRPCLKFMLNFTEIGTIETISFITLSVLSL
jgi:hypothetical protein